MVDWKKIREEYHLLDEHRFGFRNRFRADNFDLLLEACRERDERIEFLEKALGQVEEFGVCLVMVNGKKQLQIEATGKGFDNHGIEHADVDEYPELAAYLEEKNG